MVHLPAFRQAPETRVIALADAGSGRARDMCPPGCTAFSDWRDLIAQPGLDLIVIAAPPTKHEAMALMAFDHGLHVLCEKPMGMTHLQAQSMCNANHKQGRKGWVGFQFRYEIGIAGLLKSVKSGDVGDISHIDFSWLTSGRANPSRPWSWQNDAEQGGGVINAFLPHIVDLIYQIGGQDIRTATAETRILIPSRLDAQGESQHVTAEDWVHAHFECSGGLSVDATISNCISDASGFEIQVTGSLGKIVYRQRPPFAPSDMSLTLQKPDGPPIQLPLTIPAVAQPDSRGISASRLSNAVVEDLRGLPSHPPDFSDGLKVRQILDDLLQSSHT